MNSRKSAKAIPSTLNRFLKSRALLKSPPPAFYPLAAHPPPPALVITQTRATANTATMAIVTWLRFTARSLP